MPITWNPSDKDSTITLTDGDLTASGDYGYEQRGVRVTTPRSSGKLYFEGVFSGPYSSGWFGVMEGSASLTVNVGAGPHDAAVRAAYGEYRKRNNDVSGYWSWDYFSGTYPLTIGCAVDFDTGNIWFSFNGVWQGNPATGINPDYAGVVTTEVYAAWSTAYDDTSTELKLTSATVQYPVPAGFVCWDDPPRFQATGTSTASAAGFADKLGGAGAAAGSSSAAGAGTGIFPDAPVVWNSADKHARWTLSNGGKKATASSSSFPAARFVRATKYRDRGRYYFEIDTTKESGGSGNTSTSAGLANANFTDQNGLAYIGSSNSIGAEWSSNGYLSIIASESGITSSYVGTPPSRITWRFAIDFEARRCWVGYQGGWFSANDPGNALTPSVAPYVISTLLNHSSVGDAAYAPVAASAQFGAGATAILRAARADFRYEVPAGFMPWDDYLNSGIATAIASGAGAANGTSGWGNAGAAGAGVAQGAGARNADATGEAAGAGEGLAFGLPMAVYAAGTSSVSGKGIPGTIAAVAAASGVAEVVLAQSFRAGIGVGSAAGAAVSYVHSPIRELSLASEATVSHSVGGYYNGYYYTLNDGHTLFTKATPGDLDYNYSSDDDIAVTFTWPLNRKFAAIELYSSAWCDARFIGSTPDGTETFPSGAGGAVNIQVEYDTNGSSNFVDVLPIIYGNNLIRRKITFPDWVTTRRIRVTATSDPGSSTIVLAQLKAFTPSILYIQELESVAAETSSLIAVNTITLESSGAATDALLGTSYAILEDGGQASSTEASTWTYKGVGAAQGTSSAASRTILEEQLVDGGAAVDALVLSRSLKIQSAGVLGTLLSGNVTHSEVSSGNVTGTISGENVVTQSEESTGTATDTVIGIRRVTVVEISGGVTQASNASAGLATLALTSSGQAVSLAVQHSKQTVTLVSTGNADETLPAPFQGSYPIFWTNSISAGAATWEGLPFNSFIESDGVVYAAGPSGIFEMGDDIDDLTSGVSSEVEWDLVDNGSVEMKRMRSVYVNARTASPFTVRVANEQGIFEYPTESADSETVTNHRAAVGRGIVSRNVRLSLLHTKHFVAESAGVGILESKRRI